jgi:predicted HTH domain antitoxin
MPWYRTAGEDFKEDLSTLHDRRYPMTTIEVMLPEDVFLVLRKSPQEIASDVRIAAAVEWYAEGLVSQGKASELAGLSRPEFLDELAKRKVPVIQMTVEELKAELAGE